MKLDKGDWIAIIITLVAIFMMCLWCIDISVSAMLQHDPTAALTNGWRITTPTQSYHLGLWGAVICMLFLCFVIVRVMLKGFDSNDVK